MRMLVTGSSGLIGSELVEYFDARAEQVLGVDNNMRADFFGPDGDTSWNLRRLLERTRNFHQRDLDVRDRSGIDRIFQQDGPFDLIVHCAAQPSHGLAASRPHVDFEVNAPRRGRDRRGGSGGRGTMREGASGS